MVNNMNNSEIEKLSTIFERYFEEFLQFFPLEATKIADNRYDHILANDISVEHREKQTTFCKKYLQEISLIDESLLSEENRLSYDLFKYNLTSRLDWLPFFNQQRFTLLDHFIPLNQFESFPLVFAQLAAGQGNHPFKTIRDYENFLGRIDGFQDWTETAIENMIEGLEKGIISPRILMEKVSVQLRELLIKDVEKSIFYLPIINMPVEFSSLDKARLAEFYKNAIAGKLLPSYQKLYEFVNDKYLPQCRETFGIYDLPGGRERYDCLIRYHTTTNLTAEEIFQIGLDEVSKIKSEINNLKKQVGFTGDYKAFLDFVRDGTQFYPFQTEEEVLDSYRKIEAQLIPTLPKFFNTVPKATYEIRATEQFRAASASEEYLAPAPNGSRQGVFYVPIPNPQQYNYTRMESFFLHEVIPGHHYQFALQLENKNLPKFRRFTYHNVFCEGWALYAEGQGKELGLYTDYYQYLGMLIQEMHRALRLVVDVGIHIKGWNRDEAINYSLENEGLNLSKIEAEIDRYIAVPGQALSYKIGQLKVLELRRSAERTLGQNFDLSLFHDEILKGGSLPVNILEKNIQNWINKTNKT